jgi:hypothetical protein
MSKLPLPMKCKKRLHLGITLSASNSSTAANYSCTQPVERPSGTGDLGVATRNVQQKIQPTPQYIQPLNSHTATVALCNYSDHAPRSRMLT